MNKRIKKLTEQAEEYAAKNATGEWEVGLAYQDLFNKKFAELIVQECADFIDSHGGVDEYGQATDIVYGVDLMKHFGVEE